MGGERSGKTVKGERKPTQAASRVEIGFVFTKMCFLRGDFPVFGQSVLQAGHQHRESLFPTIKHRSGRLQYQGLAVNNKSVISMKTKY
jgi:hypothetical protein